MKEGDFCTFLKALRVNHNLSVYKAASQLGVSVRTLIKAENGRRQRPLDDHLVARIGTVYNVGPDQLTSEELLGPCLVYPVPGPNPRGIKNG